MDARRDLEASVTFYSKLFGTEPAKRREGYANFAIAEPPLNWFGCFRFQGEHPLQPLRCGYMDRLRS